MALLPNHPLFLLHHLILCLQHHLSAYEDRDGFHIVNQKLLQLSKHTVFPSIAKPQRQILHLHSYLHSWLQSLSTPPLSDSHICSHHRIWISSHCYSKLFALTFSFFNFGLPSPLLYSPFPPLPTPNRLPKMSHSIFFFSRFNKASSIFQELT